MKKRKKMKNIEFIFKCIGLSIGLLAMTSTKIFAAAAAPAPALADPTFIVRNHCNFPVNIQITYTHGDPYITMLVPSESREVPTPEIITQITASHYGAASTYKQHASQALSWMGNKAAALISTVAQSKSAPEQQEPADQQQKTTSQWIGVGAATVMITDTIRATYPHGIVATITHVPFISNIGGAFEITLTGLQGETAQESTRYTENLYSQLLAFFNRTYYIRSPEMSSLAKIWSFFPHAASKLIQRKPIYPYNILGIDKKLINKEKVEQRSNDLKSTLDGISENLLSIPEKMVITALIDKATDQLNRWIEQSEQPKPLMERYNPLSFFKNEINEMKNILGFSFRVLQENSRREEGDIKYVNFEDFPQVPAQQTPPAPRANEQTDDAPPLPARKPRVPQQPAPAPMPMSHHAPARISSPAPIDLPPFTAEQPATPSPAPAAQVDEPIARPLPQPIRRTQPVSPLPAPAQTPTDISNAPYPAPSQMLKQELSKFTAQFKPRSSAAIDEELNLRKGQPRTAQHPSTAQTIINTPAFRNIRQPQPRNISTGLTESARLRDEAFAQEETHFRTQQAMPRATTIPTYIPAPAAAAAAPTTEEQLQDQRRQANPDFVAKQNLFSGNTAFEAQRQAKLREIEAEEQRAREQQATISAPPGVTGKPTNLAHYTRMIRGSSRDEDENSDTETEDDPFD